MGHGRSPNGIILAAGLVAAVTLGGCIVPVYIPLEGGEVPVASDPTDPETRARLDAARARMASGSDRFDQRSGGASEGVRRTSGGGGGSPSGGGQPSGGGTPSGGSGPSGGGGSPAPPPPEDNNPGSQIGIRSR